MVRSHISPYPIPRNFKPPKNKSLKRKASRLLNPVRVKAETAPPFRLWKPKLDDHNYHDSNNPPEPYLWFLTIFYNVVKTH